MNTDYRVRSIYSICIFVLPMFIAGCVPKDIDVASEISSYQQSVADRGPQLRTAEEGVDFLRPAPKMNMPALKSSSEEAGGKKTIVLSIEEAVQRALAGSPEISVVSYNPSIAKEDFIKAASDFDPAFFGRVNYEKEDNPTDSIFQGGQPTSRLWESGIKQRGITGSEWSMSYALVRNWDDLTTSTLSTKYEPVLSFQLRQPLLRDGWEEVNLAGVNVARINYRAALVAFRQRTEAVSAEVVSLYWILVQTRRDREIQQELLEKTGETLAKLEDRKDIDATTVQIKQAEAAVKSRQAVLVQVEKQIIDVQDALVRLLSDSQLNLLDDFEIIPSTAPATEETLPDTGKALDMAMANNPEMQQARLRVDVTRINVEVAKRQKMPRLDLVASARMQGLSRAQGSAQDRLNNGDHMSYALGISYEVPIGNTQRQAEFRKRKLEHRQAMSMLRNSSDQVATQVKEAMRLAETSYEEMHVQQEAVDAARIHLQALADTEAIREKLTPEFLLVKLQAQESLAGAERSQIKALADYNIAQVRLAQAIGTVLDMRYVRQALPE
ncbi:MAG: TolC family protein [Sedimentisphaerales bacterium]|nr:TolC family protein [Sedimentisphaerales bacterium]